MADIKNAYAASSNLTVTNLHSLASSQTFIGGWESALIDNSSNKYLDYLVSAKLTIASANNQAGEIRIYVAAMLDDSTWPDVLDGTESTEAFGDTEERDAALVLGRVVTVDASAGAVIYVAPFSVASLFGGVCPEKFVIFIAGNATTTTTAQLAASGNQVSVKGVYQTVA
jgi:hypothetical protein